MFKQRLKRKALCLNEMFRRRKNYKHISWKTVHILVKVRTFFLTVLENNWTVTTRDAYFGVSYTVFIRKDINWLLLSNKCIHRYYTSRVCVRYYFHCNVCTFLPNSYLPWIFEVKYQCLCCGNDGLSQYFYEDGRVLRPTP